ncbi:universal stress protein [Mycolicibacterium duvalii]|uniref:Universal stress protein n=1 Tax=Mycolicibacterium duvalii TaxID=39688 RepID=A0A7I7JZY6_9MYCO|nr:universal stress protein [Mycolicibacterium duvalii]MCV7370188.1 universal stress protein [Mycolicibacterium duvalii]PEG38462.1 universal stress protein [Mycolicibacterium duvalii]BBX17446.1 universal stress protein [Mycolicibacterium duvalii]
MAEHTGAVVVGVDGSDAAIAATRWAGAVATRVGAPLHIVHAMVGLGRGLSEATAAIQAAIVSYQADTAPIFLKDAADAVRSDFPDLVVSTASYREPADQVLTAASREARLIVLGGNEINTASLLLLGSTTLAVAAHAHCPVVAWRGGQTALSGQPVVVGTDGSPSGTAALAAAFDVADRFGVGVRAVRGWSARLPADAVDEELHEALRAAQRAALVSETTRMSERYPAVAVEPIVEEAPAAEAVLGHCGDAQLVIVGTRGRNALASTLLGSTSLNLLQHSTVPVMVCRAETAA